MENVDPVQQESFLCILRATMEAIAKGLSASRSASADTYWTIWSALCANVALKPLLLTYMDLILILATFSAKYRCGDISASGKNVCS